MDLSFVILSWNSATFLDGCLTTLEKDVTASGLTFEVLLIDNGSKDSSLEILRGYQHRGYPLTVIPLGHNTGTTFSRNIGLRKAKGRYICVLDSDIEIRQANTLASLIAVLERHPRAGIVSPMLQYPSGNYQKSFDQFPTLINKVKRYFFLRKMEKVEGLMTFMGDDAIEVNYTISAFWLFRREYIDIVGLLDENIFYAPEDVDFCLRGWLKGLSVLFYSQVKVVHLAQEISRRKPFSKSARMHVLGLLYYFLKYRYALSLSGLLLQIKEAVVAREFLLQQEAKAAMSKPAARPVLEPALPATEPVSGAKQIVSNLP